MQRAVAAEIEATRTGALNAVKAVDALEPIEQLSKLEALRGRLATLDAENATAAAHLKTAQAKEREAWISGVGAADAEAACEAAKVAADRAAARRKAVADEVQRAERSYAMHRDHMRATEKAKAKAQVSKVLRDRIQNIVNAIGAAAMDKVAELAAARAALYAVETST